MKTFFFYLCLFGFFAIQTNINAFVLPLSSIDETFFSGQSEEITLVGVDLQVERDLEREALTGDVVWKLEAELIFQNITPQSQTLDLAIVDEEALTELTKFWFQGQLINTEPINVRYDAFNEDVPPYHAQHVSITFPSGELQRVRAVTYITPHTDLLGQIFLRLPIGLFSFWEGNIQHTFMNVALFDRPIGLQSSLSGFTFYDNPENILSWFIIDWQPQQPLEIAYMQPWSIMTLIAQRESCPDPTTLIMHITSGDTQALQVFLSEYDRNTLQFCSTLPLALYGYRFQSDSVRTQFAAIPFSRYIASESDRGSIYRENASFQRDDLVGIEAIYHRTLDQTR